LCNIARHCRLHGRGAKNYYYCCCNYCLSFFV